MTEIEEMETTSGIITRTVRVTETSLVVHWITAGIGRIATLAKGANRPNSQFRGKLDLFYELELVLYRKRSPGLHLLKEVTLVDTHAGLRRSVEKLTQASYCCALIEKVTEPETPIPEIYQLFRNFLRNLASADAHPLMVLAFELKLTDALGIAPSVDNLPLSAGSKKIIKTVLTEDWGIINRIVLSATQLAELDNFLRDHITSQIGSLPDTRAAALSVGES